MSRDLFRNFKINLSTSANISYRILPAPHFLIKDSKIIVEYEDKPVEIAEIKRLKVFFYQSNFFLLIVHFYVDCDMIHMSYHCY